MKIPHILRLNFGFIPLELQAADAGSDPTDMQPFLATITYAGICSDGPVGGTELIEGGPYKIFIPVDLMAKRGPELKGKGVFAAMSLDTHEGTSRVGLFSDAYLKRLVGTEIHMLNGGGFFDMSKNADLMAKIMERARTGELGFSYDIKDAPGHLESLDIYAGMSSDPRMETVLVLDDFKWRGATILRRETAAYSWTTLAASRAITPSGRSADRSPIIIPSADPAHAAHTAGNHQRLLNNGEGNLEMNEAQIRALLESLLSPIATSIATLSAGMNTVGTRLQTLEAARPPAAAPAVPPAAAPAAGLTFKDFKAGLLEAIQEANKPLLDAITAMSVAEPGTGQRLTLSAAQIQLVERFGGETAKDNPASLESIEAAIATVQAQYQTKTIRQDQAGQMIATLRAAKRSVLQNPTLGEGRTN